MKDKSTHYMAIDQSLTGTGITICDGKNFKYFLIKTEKIKGTKCPTIDYTRRLLQLKHEIQSMIVAYEIHMAAIEGMAFGARGSTVFDLGGLSHLIREAFMETNVKFIVVPPTVLKKHWAGKGNANKIDMICEAEKRELQIPFLKKYKEFPDKKFDDNVVDSAALCDLLLNHEKYIGTIECSWDLYE